MKEVYDGIFEAETDEEKSRFQDEWNSLTDSEKLQGEIGGIYIALIEALNKKDYFAAIESIGILKYLRDPNVDYYSGLVKYLLKDYSGAAEEYKKIKPSSEMYCRAMENLSDIYEVTGNYILLDQIFSDEHLKLSPMVRLKKRLNCLEHINHNEFSSQKDVISGCHVDEAFLKKGDEVDGHAFYQICRMLSDMLIISGECINQCLIHQYRTEKKAIDFENNQDTKEIVSMYEKCVFILELSKYLKSIKINGIDSLADCALANKSWNEKICIFQNPAYHHEIVHIVVNMCHPSIHKFEKPYSIIHNLLDELIHVQPIYVQTLLNMFFDDIKAAAESGESSAIQYLGFAYADIVAHEEDHFKLKDKIKVCLDTIPEFDSSNIVKQRKLSLSMGRRSSDALNSAERTFIATQKKYYGIHDASALALMFFRVIEIEYNDKLVCPLINAIDIKKLKDICGIGKLWKNRTEYEKKSCSLWEKEINIFDDLFEGKRKSLELGTIRTLLVKIKRYDGGLCQVELQNSLFTVLTNDGKQAFLSEEMMDVIGRANVDKYRNPGAHTGYVPYSGACDARQYVLSKLPAIESWFITEAR